MITMTMFLKRKAGLSAEDFAEHHERVHGPLMRSIPEAREHLVRYSQVHPRGLTTDAVPLSGFDGVAELWFDSMAGLEAVMGSETFRTQVAADEATFLDRDATTVVVGERTEVVGDASAELAAQPLSQEEDRSLPRGINHVGLTVPDLEAATTFLASAFGAKVAYDGLTAQEPPREGAETERQLGLPSGARIRAQRMLQIGTGPSLEMFEVETPERQDAAGLADLGWQHVALFVDDLEATLARAVAAGATALSEPHPNSRHEDTEGNASVYVRPPWGGLLELQQLPAGHWYGEDSESTVWTPPRRTAA
ncbi:EthD family reductase [Pseudokineococcus sp. 1T1Z-3]|uniref:EthD family reductase n=1 Tax=Pseudokineococcus sp. 1T1Z-3 TaxID=3132745 RepID=UPI0030A917BA